MKAVELGDLKGAVGVNIAITLIDPHRPISHECKSPVYNSYPVRGWFRLECRCESGSRNPFICSFVTAVHRSWGCRLLAVLSVVLAREISGNG